MFEKHFKLKKIVINFKKLKVQKYFNLVILYNLFWKMLFRYKVKYTAILNALFIWNKEMKLNSNLNQTLTRSKISKEK